MSSCTWTGGCIYAPYPWAGLPPSCYFHGKVRWGLIDSTRGGLMSDVRPVAMSRTEREEASRRRDNYHPALPPAALTVFLEAGGRTFDSAPLSPLEATNTTPNPHSPRFYWEVSGDRENDRRHGAG